MRAKTWIAFIGMLGLFVPYSRQGVPAEQPSVLGLTLRTSLVRPSLPVTKALEEVGIFVQAGYVMFGTEIRSPDGREPPVKLTLEAGSTLGEALKQIISQTPGYTFAVVSPHFVEVFPVDAKDDPRDALDTFVAKFDIIDGDPGRLLSDPQAFIPELAERLRSKPSGAPQPSGVFGSILEGSPESRVTLHLQRVTVRQILDAVSEAMEQLPPQYPPVGWSCMFQPQADAPGRGRYTWSFSWSVPRDWKQESAKHN